MGAPPPDWFKCVRDDAMCVRVCENGLRQCAVWRRHREKRHGGGQKRWCDPRPGGPGCRRDWRSALAVNRPHAKQSQQCKRVPAKRLGERWVWTALCERVWVLCGRICLGWWRDVHVVIPAITPAYSTPREPLQRALHPTGRSSDTAHIAPVPAPENSAIGLNARSVDEFRPGEHAATAAARFNSPPFQKRSQNTTMAENPLALVVWSSIRWQQVARSRENCVSALGREKWERSSNFLSRILRIVAQRRVISA